jgi:hypothetical protein
MKYPVGYRIRMAMQYGKSFDEYEKYLCEGNSGDYANSWLFGNINDNSIMRIELGLKYANTEIIYTSETREEPMIKEYEIDGVSIIRTETYNKNGGYFIGFNAPYDPRIRQMECGFSGFYDIRRHQGARQVRLEELMEKYKGKLNVENAKTIIADHYDVYLKKENNPCSRTVCSHYELDAREYMSDPSRPKPYSLHGAVDACIIDTNTAEEMGIWGRFGNSCGTPFDINKFCDEHIQWKAFRHYVRDRPTKEWTYFKQYDWSSEEEKEVMKEEYNKEEKEIQEFKEKEQQNEEKEEKDNIKLEIMEPNNPLNPVLNEKAEVGGTKHTRKIKKTRKIGKKNKRVKRTRRMYGKNDKKNSIMKGGEFDEEQDKSIEEYTRTEQ